MVLALSAVAPERPALVTGDGTPISFGALDQRANRLANVLRAAGIQPGDRIAVLCGNTPRFFEAAAAGAHGGVRYVLVNWHWAPREVAYVLADSGAKAFVVDDIFDELAQKALDLLRDDHPEQARDLIVLGPAGLGGAAGYEAALERASTAEPPDQRLGNPMFYTSGTTGFPKGVTSATPSEPPPADVLAGIAKAVVTALRMPVGGTQLLCGPAYHSAQFTWAVLPVFAGNTIVLHERFDAEATLEAIDTHSVTGVHLVPTQFVRLLRLSAEVRDAHSVTSLAAVWHGAAPCAPEVKRQMLEWWGPRIWEYYGGTEGGLLSTVSPEEWLARPGTVGRIAAGYEVQVTDDSGTPCPPRTSGQIWFRRSTGEDFAYHNAPDKTAAAHRDGWATLGDVGWFDEDGYLYLSDRAIDMIISGGVNIYPAEIEAALLLHPAVADIAVFGVADDEFGESVRAAVELTPDWSVDADGAIAAIRAHAREQLAGYKVPRAFDVVDALPRLASGKLQKRLLRERFATSTR